MAIVKPDSKEGRRRIEADEGDPTDIVYRSGNHHASQCYHGDPSCHLLESTGDLTSLRRESAQRHLVPCRYCVDGLSVRHSTPNDVDPRDLVTRLRDNGYQLK